MVIGRALSGVILLATLVIGLSGLPTAQALPLGGEYGGDFRIGTVGSLTVSPQPGASGSALLWELTYDSLARLDPNTREPVPWLASSWEGNDSTNAVQVTVRTDATWSDGTPVTGADVVATFQRYSSSGFLSGFTVGAVGNVVTFTFTANGGDFLTQGLTAPIAFKSGSSTPTSSGPFSIQASSPARVDLKANDEYYRGRPFLDSVTILSATSTSEASCLLSNQTAHLLAFPVTTSIKSTEIDCYDVPGRPTNPATVTLGNLSHVGFAEDPGFRIAYLGFNAGKSPTNDPALRNAIHLVMNKDLYQTSAGGSSSPAYSILNPAVSLWYNNSVPRVKADRDPVSGEVLFDKARLDLSQAGYLDVNSDGFLERPDGSTFSLKLLRPLTTEELHPAIAEDINTNLLKLGLNVTAEQLSFDQIEDRIVASDDFDLYILLNETQEDPSFLFDQFHSANIGGSNVVNLANATLDGLLEKGRDSVELSSRQSAVQDSLGWLAENSPIVPLLHFTTTVGRDKTDWEGWVSLPGGVVNFWSLYGLHLVQRGELALTLTPRVRSVFSNGSVDVILTAKDGLGTPVEGASIELRDSTGWVEEVLTDSDGQMQVSWRAPTVNGTTNILISAKARAARYTGTDAEVAITVRPLLRTLTVTLGAKNTTITSGDAVDITVTVEDETGSPVVGANVTFVVSPEGSGGTLASLVGTTDSAGKFTTSFSGDVTTPYYFAIRAQVTKDGFASGKANTAVIVNAQGSPAPFPWAEIALIVAIVVLAGLLAWMLLRNRPKGPPKPKEPKKAEPKKEVPPEKPR